jgi:hypothetical protein
MSDDVEPTESEVAFPTAAADPPMRMGIDKRGSVTFYTLECDEAEHQRHMHAFGTKDLDFFHGLLQQIVNAGGKGQYPDEGGIKFMLALVRAQKPKDEIEATLLAEIGACQLASMRAVNQLAHAESLQEQDIAERTFNKLARSLVALIEAFQRYRAGSGQRVILQQVLVNNGGQPIADNVSQRERRATLSKHIRETRLAPEGRQLSKQAMHKPQQRRRK